MSTVYLLSGLCYVKPRRDSGLFFCLLKYISNFEFSRSELRN